MKIFEGVIADLLSKDTQDLLINTLILAFISQHNLYPSEDKILCWKEMLDFSLFTEDEWFKDAEFIHRVFFPQLCKKLELVFSRDNYISLELKPCVHFPLKQKGKNTCLRQEDIGKLTEPGDYIASETSFL